MEYQELTGKGLCSPSRFLIGSSQFLRQSTGVLSGGDPYRRGPDKEVGLLPNQEDQNKVNYHTVAVLAPDGTRLNPTTPGKARILKAQGKAVVECCYPDYAIRLTYWPKPKEQLEVQPTALHLDDGETVGVAVVQHNAAGERVVWAGEVITTGRNMSDRLADRGRVRRYRKRLGRKKRGKSGHLKPEQPGKAYPPSIELDVLQKVRVAGRLCRLFPISEIVVETISVDIRKVLEPTVTGSAYQQPRTIRAKVKWALPTVCAVCGAALNEQNRAVTHHQLKQQKNGPRNFTNEIPLCVRCHQEAGDSELCLDAGECRDTRAFGRLQHGRELLLAELSGLAPVREVRGYQTARTRRELGLPKTHIHDAVAAGCDGKKPVTLPVMTRQVHNPTGRTRKLFDENFGVAKYRKDAERQPGVDAERMRVDDHDHAHIRRNDVVRTTEGWLGKAWALMSNGTVKILFTETQGRKHPFTQRIPGKLQVISRKLCWLPVKENGR